MGRGTSDATLVLRCWAMGDYQELMQQSEQTAEQWAGGTPATPKTQGMPKTLGTPKQPAGQCCTVSPHAQVQGLGTGQDRTGQDRTRSRVTTPRIDIDVGRASPESRPARRFWWQVPRVGDSDQGASTKRARRLVTLSSCLVTLSCRCDGATSEASLRLDLGGCCSITHGSALDDGGTGGLGHGRGMKSGSGTVEARARRAAESRRRFAWKWRLSQSDMEACVRPKHPDGHEQQRWQRLGAVPSMAWRLLCKRAQDCGLQTTKAKAILYVYSIYFKI